MGIIISYIGAFLNRVRGGLFQKLEFNKIFLPIFYVVLIAFAMDYSNVYLAVGLLVLHFGAFYLGQQLPWGGYIGALTVGYLNLETKDKDVAFITKLINKSKYLKKHPRLWGFCSLGLRGLLWTIPIGLLNLSPIIALSGLLMPVSYGLATIIELLIRDKNKQGFDKTAWNLGEVIWGGVLFSVIYMEVFL